jgi:hypothetical protein
LVEPWELDDVSGLWVARHGHDNPSPNEYDSFRTSETEAFYNSFLFAARNYFVIENKRGVFVPFEPMAGQMMLHICIESQRQLGLRQQVVEIKPRQIGWTTYLLGRALWQTMKPNMKASIMVRDEKVADELSKRLATMYNMLPNHLRPMKRIDNLKFVVFDNPNSVDRQANPGLNSSIFIGVPSAQRGRTPHYVVASEYAFWDPGKQDDFMTGLVGAMPLDDSACVIIDTTPNGHDDGYEPLAMEAIERNPKWVKSWESKETYSPDLLLSGRIGYPDNPHKGFVPAFWPWFKHETYTTKDEHPFGELPKMSKAQWSEVVDSLGKMSRYGNDEEERLVKDFGVGIPRLYWRRRKIDSYFTSSRINDERLRILVFQQEYATTWRDCFVDYNQSPFDAIALDYIGRNHVKMPAARGLLRREGSCIVLDTTWQSDYEEFKVYAPPESGEKYVMGVDTQIAFDSDEADFTVAQILRVKDRKIVGTYRAKVPVYRLREQLHLLYEWYNRPYYAIETEGIGYGLIRELIDLGMHNTYFWKRLDAMLPEDTKYPGWETNHKTRPIMEQALIECLAHRDPDGRPDPLVIITDYETFREIESLKRDSTGKIAAGSRAHDDCAMALMICLAIMQETSFPYSLELPEYKRDKKVEQRREVNALMKRWGKFSSSEDRNNPDLALL